MGLASRLLRLLRRAGLLVLEATCWATWWVTRSLVVWGAALCGDPRISAQPVPRPLPRSEVRRERRLTREVERGIARLEDYLAESSAAAPERRPRRHGNAPAPRRRRVDEASRRRDR